MAHFILLLISFYANTFVLFVPHIHTFSMCFFFSSVQVAENCVWHFKSFISFSFLFSYYMERTDTQTLRFTFPFRIPILILIAILFELWTIWLKFTQTMSACLNPPWNSIQTLLLWLLKYVSVNFGHIKNLIAQI